MHKTSPGDISISPSYDGDDSLAGSSFQDLRFASAAFLHEDRFAEEKIYRYPPQFLQNRTNPYLLSSEIPEHFRFAHPLLNKMVYEYEDLLTYCNDPNHVCKEKVKVKRSESWLDVDDIEGVNWKNHWILRKQAIYKHWRESRENRKSSEMEFRVDDEVVEEYKKAKAIADEEEAKLQSAKDKVFNFLDEQEREGMIQQKIDMEKAVDKTTNFCQEKDNPKENN